MCTKFFSDGEVHKYFNPYGTPYEAFINYMNVLSDFKIRLNAFVPVSVKDEEIAHLKELVTANSKKLESTETELKKLRRELATTKLTQNKLAAPSKADAALPKKGAAPAKVEAKVPAKKTPAKKAPKA
jgi:alpha-amylase